MSSSTTVCKRILTRKLGCMKVSSRENSHSWRPVLYCGEVLLGRRLTCRDAFAFSNAVETAPVSDRRTDSTPDTQKDSFRRHLHLSAASCYSCRCSYTMVCGYIHPPHPACSSVIVALHASPQPREWEICRGSGDPDTENVRCTYNETATHAQQQQPQPSSQSQEVLQHEARASAAARYRGTVTWFFAIKPLVN